MIEYFRKNPQQKKRYQAKYKPIFAHYFPVILHRHNLLKRVYTQNIDGLERMADLPSDKIVECHGTYYTAHCQKCQNEYDLSEIKDTMEKGQIPKCSSCIDGVVKTDIVFFGEKFFK